MTHVIISGLLNKLEKGIVGMKWKQKYVEADAEKLMYFANTKPKSGEMPRKVFDYANCAIDKTTAASRKKMNISSQNSFIVEDRRKNYVAIFSCDSETELQRWVNILQQARTDRLNKLNRPSMVQGVSVQQLEQTSEKLIMKFDYAHDSPEFANIVFKSLSKACFPDFQPDLGNSKDSKVDDDEDTDDAGADDVRHSNHKEQDNSDFIQIPTIHLPLLVRLLGGRDLSFQDHEADIASLLELSNEMDPSNSGFISLPKFMEWVDDDGLMNLQVYDNDDMESVAPSSDAKLASMHDDDDDDQHVTKDDSASVARLSSLSVSSPNNDSKSRMSVIDDDDVLTPVTPITPKNDDGKPLKISDEWENDHTPVEEVKPRRIVKDEDDQDLKLMKKRSFKNSLLAKMMSGSEVAVDEASPTKHAEVAAVEVQPVMIQEVQPIVQPIVQPTMQLVVHPKEEEKFVLPIQEKEDIVMPIIVNPVDYKIPIKLIEDLPIVVISSQAASPAFKPNAVVISQPSIVPPIVSKPIALPEPKTEPKQSEIVTSPLAPTIDSLTFADLNESITIDNGDPMRAQIIPSEGPDDGGIAIIIKAAGISGFEIVGASICGSPAIVESQMNDKVLMTLGAFDNKNIAQLESKKTEFRMTGNIILFTKSDEALVFPNCFSIISRISFKAKSRIRAGVSYNISGYIVTDFGDVQKESDSYGISLTFDEYGLSVVKQWHRRYFSLSSGVLMSSSSESDSKAVEVLNVHRITSISLASYQRIGRQNVVEVHYSQPTNDELVDRVLYLQANSQHDATEWSGCLQQAVYVTIGMPIVELPHVEASTSSSSSSSSGRTHKSNETKSNGVTIVPPRLTTPTDDRVPFEVPQIDPKVHQFLSSLDIDTDSSSSIEIKFRAEQIDISALMMLNEQDLRELTIPMGPRKKILNAIQQLEFAMPSTASVYGAAKNQKLGGKLKKGRR